MVWGLPKEQITDKDCCNNSCSIGYQSARNGMTGFGDSYTAEIYGQDIEGGIGRTLEDTSQSAYETHLVEILVPHFYTKVRDFLKDCLKLG